jgi:hypothetical protein
MVCKLSEQKLKNYKFKLKTLHVDDDLNVFISRKNYKNTLYIYVYERALLRDTLLVAFKVTVYE